MKLKGKIVNIISNIFYVEVEEKIIQCTSRGVFKTKDLKPVVGDDVLIEVENNTGSILEIIDRKNYIKRPKMANLAQLILVVSSKDPTPDLLMLDKQLAFAEFLNMKPIIVVNKIDLAEEVANEIEKIYSNIGYQVIQTNAKNGIHIDKLKECLQGKISAFSGNSGVGKSTLINGIFNKEVTEEGEISKKNKRGKNTTTAIKLYKIDENTYIADTPGFSTFDISEIESNDLANYFIEFQENIKNCEFVGCTHIKEENCGIKMAIKQGKIKQERYDRFCKIYTELKEKEEHKKW